MTLRCALALALLASVARADHQEPGSPADKGAVAGRHVVFTPDELTWTDGPAALPPGAKVATLEGDPAAPGPFTMRLRLPARYEIPAHFHPADEHVTVLSGELFMGMGDRLDREKGRALGRGGFALMPAGLHHFAYTDGEAEIQVHGMGPWGITYLDPATDPRTKATAETGTR